MSGSTPLSPHRRDLRLDPEEAEQRVAALADMSARELLLTGFSVIPFLLLGAVAVIAVGVTVLVAVFGLGSGVDPLWSRLDGQSLGRALFTILETLVMIGLAAGVAVVAMLATNHGLKARQRRWFWPAIIVTAALLAVLPVAVHFAHPAWFNGVTGGVPDWGMLTFLGAYTAFMAELRRRHSASVAQ